MFPTPGGATINSSYPQELTHSTTKAIGQLIELSSQSNMLKKATPEQRHINQHDLNSNPCSLSFKACFAPAKLQQHHVCGVIQKLVEAAY